MLTTSFKRMLRYNVLTSATAIAAVALAAPVASQDVVVAEGQNDSDGVVLVDGGSLTNGGTITNAGPADPAVYLATPGNIVFVVNSRTGVITAVGDAGVAIDGNVGEFTNHGQITSDDFGAGASGTFAVFRNSGSITSNDDQAVGSIAGFGTFINEASGVLVGLTRGVGTDGDTGRFENHGVIAAQTDSAVGTGGQVGTFINTGRITSQGEAGVSINGAVGSFDNSGTIEGAENRAVRLNGGVGSFVNQTTGVIRNIAAAGSDGHGVGLSTDLTNGGRVAAFENHGVIQGDHASPESWGVGLFDNSNMGPNAFQTGSFINTGTISASAGVLGRGGFESFSNSGTISGTMRSGVASDGAVGTFTNSGTIAGGEWDAVYLGGGVGEFVNSASGTIRNVNHNGVAGNGVAFDTEIGAGGAVGSFVNHGTISADPSSPDGAGVGFFSNNQPAYQNGSFLNTGTIVGTGSGVYSEGGFTSFSNSGTISAQQYAALRIEGPVGTFENSGTLTSAEDRGVDFIAPVESFNNSGNIQSFQNGVTFRSTFGTATNSGTIISTAPSGEIGLRIDEAGGTFTNSGEIRGPAGVVYILSAAGPNTFINSGVIEGRNGGAIDFEGGADGGNDSLVLRTGSELYGDINFGGGSDSLDLSGFSGNALIRAFGLENLEAGQNLIFMDGPDTIGVVEPTGITAAAPLMALDTTTQIRNLIASELSAEPTSLGSPDLLMGYAPVVGNEASLAITDAGQAGQTAFWTSLVGGGSADDGPVPASNVFGGVVAGSHAQFGDGRLGLLGGVTAGQVDVNSGGQEVSATTGIVGIYGGTELGVVELDFSVLAGLAANRSERRVVTPGGAETAVAEFGSWFLSPSLGVAVPVLSTEAGTMQVTGRISYIGGSAAAYTETGSALALSVGDQSISLLDARFGLAGDFVTGGTEHGNITVSAKSGVFVQSNLDDASTPVTLFGQTQGALTPDSTEWGVYAGAGMAADVGSNIQLTAGVDGQARFDGLVSAAARVGIAGSF